VNDLERVEQRPKRIPASWWVWIGFAVVVIGIFIGLPRFLESRKLEPFYGGALYDLQPAADFVLTDQDGEPFGKADLAGKVSYLYFGFTNCPNVCPVGLANLAMLNRLLTPEERAKVQIVFISVDPERDTPEVLHDYVPFFDASFVGLTGSAEEIAAMAKDYGVFYNAHPLEGTDDYTVDHSSTVYLLDPRGNLLATYRHDQLANGEAMAKDLRRVLAGESR
jgi:protein SCO1/2